jgi:hypothetical protein
MSHIFAFVTCTRVMWPEGSEEYVDEHGWIDMRWSPRVLHESRNDVRPVVDCDESDRETLIYEVTEALSDLAPYWDNGDGTFYGEESEQPFDEPWNYSYAVHFKRKYLGPNGWTEDPWHPAKDGGLDV